MKEELPRETDTPKEQDLIETYFECLTVCDDDDNECQTECVVILKE